MDQSDKDWWRHGIFYQVYPRSFQDTDGDGVGDIRGIIERLPYLKSLGIDAVWLSPIFPSPMADFGYDISDYTGIDPLFGTMDDFDALVSAAHETASSSSSTSCRTTPPISIRGSSKAARSRDNPKRDWYIWRDAGAGRRRAEQLAVGIRRQRLGNMTMRPVNITTTRFSPSSRI